MLGNPVNKNTLIHVKEHHTPIDVLQTVWGQILKDAEFYNREDAVRMVFMLHKLGYETAFDFMTHEYAVLYERTKMPAPSEPVYKPHHYMIGVYGGTQAIYISTDKDAVRKAADQDAGLANITFIRPATEAEVEWHKAMGGRMEVVDPAP